MKNFTKNPYLNSVYAELYILIVAGIMQIVRAPNTPDTFLDPVVVLSLFVLSAAVMGYFFVGEPLMLYLAGEKKQAVAFFMKTVAGFAVLTIAAITLLKLFSN